MAVMVDYNEEEDAETDRPAISRTANGNFDFFTAKEMLWFKFCRIKFPKIQRIGALKPVSELELSQA